MFKKFSLRALLVLVLSGFLLLNLSWAQKSAKVKKQGWLGVYLQELTTELKESLDLDKSTEGVLVSGVVEDSPAEKGGVEDGDVIISFDGKKVDSIEKLTSLVEKTSPGTEVDLKVLRDGEEKDLSVTVEASSLSNLYEKALGKSELKKKMVEPFVWSFRSGSRMGIAIQDLSEQLGEYFGVKDGEGALISQIQKDSPAEKAGLKAGDVIVEMDGQKIKGTDDVLKIVSEKEKGEKVSLKVLRERKPRDFSITLTESEKEWSLGMLPDIEKIKKIEISPEKLTMPEAFFWKGYTSDESKLKKDLNELKKEMEELKKELEQLKEDLKK